ncbi:transposase [Paeniglutamicibacter sp.]|uniref:transposase n=1 Tax=Paeniglutamicibacter sp. TaxID=1934391 RepID=UPI003988C76E
MPDAVMILDAFHVVKPGRPMVDDVRRRVQKEATGKRGLKERPPLQIPPTPAARGRALQGEATRPSHRTARGRRQGRRGGDRLAQLFHEVPADR